MLQIPIPVLNESLAMKRLASAALLVALLTGCSNSSPPASPPTEKKGIEVHAPGVDVKVDKEGVDVKAPGADVEIDRKK